MRRRQRGEGDDDEIREDIVGQGLALVRFAGYGAGTRAPRFTKKVRSLKLPISRSKPGRFDDYMKYLDTTYKTLMEANKKEGLIIGYAV